MERVEGKIAPGETIKVLWRSMPDLGPSFEQFAGGLKAAAESST